MKWRQGEAMRINMPLWWSFLVVFAACMALVGCDSPSPAFRDVPARAVSVDGSRFSVRATRWRAEAVRTSAQAPPVRNKAVIRGALAILKVTGCPLHLASVEGDEVMVRADLNCPGAGPAPTRRARPPELDCGLVTGFRADGFGGKVAQVECDVIGIAVRERLAVPV